MTNIMRDYLKLLIFQFVIKEQQILVQLSFFTLLHNIAIQIHMGHQTILIEQRILTCSYM